MLTKKRAWLQISFMVIMSAFNMTCGGRTIDDGDNRCNESCDDPSILTAHIRIDSDFEDPSIIVEALAQWEAASGGVFNPKVTIEPVNEGDDNAIVRLTLDSKITTDFDSDPENKDNGLFLAGMRINKTMYVIPERTVDNIKAVTIHEIGHWLGLEHSQDLKDVMTPVNPTATCVSWEDIEFFCQKWDCSATTISSTCKNQ